MAPRNSERKFPLVLPPSDSPDSKQLTESTRLDFILKVNTNSPFLNKILNKYIAMFNFFFESLSQRQLYIEIVLDGFIVIWPSIEEFQKSFIPYSEEMKRKGLSIKPENNILHILHPPKDCFPPEGLKIMFQSESHTMNDVFPILHVFYTSFDQNIKVSANDGCIEVLFISFEQALRYFQTIFIFFQETYDLFDEE